MKVNSKDIISICMVVILITGSLEWPDSDIINISTGECTARLPVFTVWWAQGDLYTVQTQETYAPFQVYSDHFPSLIKIDRASMIMRTYCSHNKLHFNIPLTCCKFSISQYTCDGWQPIPDPFNSLYVVIYDDWIPCGDSVINLFISNCFIYGRSKKMKDFVDTTIQIVFLLVGLGLGFWLLYFSFRSPGKSQGKGIEIDNQDPNKKTAGKI